MSFDDIKYEPSLEPEKDYRSDIDYNLEEIEEPEETISDVDKTIEEEIESTIVLIPMLPEKVQRTVQDNIDLIRDHMKELKEVAGTTQVDDEPEDTSIDDKANEILPEEEDKDKEDSKEEESESKVEMESGDNSNMPFVIPIIKRSQQVAVDEIGEETLIEVISNYLNGVRNIVADYLNGINYYMFNAEIEYTPKILTEYKESTSELDSHVKHIGDEIIKSQIIKEQKGRLFDKISHNDNLAIYLNQILLNRIKHKRYEDINRKDEKVTVDVYANRQLDTSKKNTLDQNKLSIYNLHKQLESSNQVLKDYVDMDKREAQLKVILIQEENL